LRWQDTLRFIRFIKQKQDVLENRILCITSWGAMRAWALARIRPQNADIRLLFHGSEILKIQHNLWLWKRFFQPLLAQDNVTCIATTPYVHDLLQKSPCFPKNRLIPLAPCGLGVFFKKLPPPNIAPISLSEEILILSVARMDPRKGQLEALQALIALPENIRERVCYHMIGSGSQKYLDKLLRLARRHNLRCVHTSNASDESLSEAYSKAYLLLQPSRALKHSVEGFGLSVIEAASRGCPAIAYDSGGLTSAIIDGTTGWIVPEGNIQALSKAILEAIENPKERHRRALAAREHAMQHSYRIAVDVLLR
jgi:glycosyltransferase involved in cell wall biosynthesis